MHVLTKRIQQREAAIDRVCGEVAAGVNQSVSLAFEQGDDLLQASVAATEQEFATLLRDTFGSSNRATGYMKLAAKTPIADRATILSDSKLLKSAMKTLDLLPEDTSQPATRSVSIPPIIQRLTWLAEWTGRNQDAVRKWQPEQRAELKQQLAPVVELWETL